MILHIIDGQWFSHDFAHTNILRPHALMHSDPPIWPSAAPPLRPGLPSIGLTESCRAPRERQRKRWRSGNIRLCMTSHFRTSKFAKTKNKHLSQSARGLCPSTSPYLRQDFMFLSNPYKITKSQNPDRFNLHQINGMYPNLRATSEEGQTTAQTRGSGPSIGPPSLVRCRELRCGQ